MSARIAALALAGLLPTGASAADADMSKQPPRRSTELPRPRDGNVAIGEELDAARRTGTVEAYDLFIARHRDHPLARVARRERESLSLRPKARRQLQP